MPRLNQVMNTNLESRELYSITMDWSEFDINVPEWMLDDVFDIIKGMIDFTKMSDSRTDFSMGFTANKASQYENAFDWIKWNFIHTKIMDIDGTMYRKNHGIPSGSFFTQLVGSMVNMLSCHFLMSLHDMKITEERYLGDDSLIYSSVNSFSPSVLESFSNCALVFFHFKLNPKKVKCTKENGTIKFLGYKTNGDRFIKDGIELLQSALYTENRVKYLYISASRMLSYYILGGCNSPIFCAFFEFFKRKYELEKELVVFKPTTSIKRIFKYVLGFDIINPTVVDFTKLNDLFIPYSLSRSLPVSS